MLMSGWSENLCASVRTMSMHILDPRDTMGQACPAWQVHAPMHLELRSQSLKILQCDGSALT